MSARAQALTKPTTVQQLAKAKWRSSGLSDEQARTSLLVALDGDGVAKLAPNFLNLGALKIPYFTLQGEETGFFRIRYLETINSFGKPPRYAQPKDTINEIYFSPILPNWGDVALNVSIPIIITEGELKAAAGCAAGFPTIGLGGVDVWRSSKRLLAVLPQLLEVQWKDRQVYICFDSDVATKPAVVAAQRRLARELLDRGARPEFIRLPPPDEGDKQGLDDFLVAHGADAFQELLKDTLIFPEAEALWQMNEELIFIKNPGMVIERSSGFMMAPEKFTGSVYANRHYSTVDSKGKLIKKPLAPRWLAWEHRAEAPKIVYAPGQPKMHKGNWNVWDGWGCEPTPGDIGPWNWLLDFAFGKDVETRRWFERWCAYPIQHPGEKMYTAMVFWSVAHGTGKTLIAYTLMKIYGEKNSQEVNNEALRKPFNSWAKHKQFIYADEITGGQARMDSDKLKGMISRHNLTVEEKFIPSYVIDDCINYLFTGNHPDTVFVEGADRRFAVKEIVGPPASEEKYKEYDRWLKGDGPSHLFHHLLHLDLGDFNPKGHAPINADKRVMIESCRGELLSWVHHLIEDPVSALMPLGKLAATNCDLFTPALLLKAFDPMDKWRNITPALMSKTLHAAGIQQLNGANPVRTAVGLKRLYAVRNQAKWARVVPNSLARHFEKYFATEGGMNLPI